ncbi:MAG: hypothetical protein ACI4UM_08155 [Succinivibrio sp.]
MMFKGKEVKEIAELDCFSLTGIADKQFIGLYEPGENEDKVLLQVVNLERLLEGGGETLFGDIYCIKNCLAFVDPDDPHTANVCALQQESLFEGVFKVLPSVDGEGYALLAVCPKFVDAFSKKEVANDVILLKEGSYLEDLDK